MDVNDLTSRAAKYDESLARDIADYVRGRRYGLVYEASKPEFVRLWNKPVVRGDLVNVLPPRGKQEDTRRDDDPFDIAYRLVSEDDGIASLRDIKSGEQVEAPVEDLVAIARFDQPIYCGLKETGRVERGGDKPYHVVINGENYHALQTLTYAYAGKVDCIYIDPPYNTGAKDWKYNNNYVSSDDTYRHSKWLTFMEDRLKVAKKLLNPKDSVLICTIDEKEYLRLGLLLEQLFPSDRIQMVNIIINKNGVSRDNEFKRAEEYAFCVMIGSATPAEMDTTTYSPFDDGKDTKPQKVRWERLLRGGSNSLRTDRPNLFYPIYIDENKRTIEAIGQVLKLDEAMEDAPVISDLRALWPIRTDGTEATWRMQPSSLQKKIDKGLVRIGAYDKKNDRYSIVYLADVQEKRIAKGDISICGKRDDGSLVVEYANQKKSIPTTVWGGAAFSAGEYGSRLITSIFNDKRFSFPKSFYATELTIAPFVLNKPNALILDFFAGSGTTAHSTMLLNKLDGGHRRCICVTNNEVSVDEAKAMTKRGLRTGDPEWEERGIARYVTIPRVTAVITGRTPGGEPIKGDYKFTDEFPMADGFEENAIFYDLTYLEPSVVSADLAFDEIAPILWLRGGCRGPVLHREPGYAVGETYAVLFDYGRVRQFIDAIHDDEKISHVFIVTDVKSRYRGMCAEFPDRDVAQLYESYLRSFEINVEE